MPKPDNQVKLTKTYLKGREPKDKEYAVYDRECSGFHVRVFPSGRITYTIAYRDERGRSQKKKLGTFPELSVESARTQAQTFRADLTRGYDQFAEMRRRRDIPTLEMFWDVYLEQHARKTKAPRSIREDEINWRKRISPRFGGVPLDQIEYSDVAKWHANERNHPIAMNRALALFSKIMTLAEKHALITRNPCRGVTKNPEEPRDIYLNPEQCRTLFAALDEDQDRGGALLIKLLVLTGARLNEALSAKWTEFDLERKVWSVPSSHIKGGRRLNIKISRSLSEYAVAMLEDWKAQNHNSEGLVFPSAKGPDNKRHDVKTVWRRAYNRCDLPAGLRIHDLRHTFASTALEGGMSLDQIGLEMGHRSRQTTARYTHLAESRRETAAETVANQLGLS